MGVRKNAKMLLIKVFGDLLLVLVLNEIKFVVTFVRILALDV